MSFRPFISATKEDLEDCRGVVVNAARKGGGGEPLTMENWDTEAVDAVEVCRSKIDEGTHYVGVFAHRRGWTPSALKGKSITEAEYDWAVDYRKPMCVFMPKPATEFDLELRERAKAQGEVEARAQKDFVRRVRQAAACQDFENLPDLAIRATVRFGKWSSLPGGIGKEADRGREAREQPRRVRTPSEDEVMTLGREEHVRQFKATLDVLLGPGFPRAVCFLVHGLHERGHRQLARRLRRELEARWRPREYQISLSPLWRQDTVAKLLQAFGHHFGPGVVPASVEDFASRLGTVLDADYVVLEVGNVQRLGGLHGFVEDFWRPLLGVLGGQTKHRLIVLATLEETLPLGSEAYVQPAPEEDVKVFDPNLLVSLPELGPFTESELRVWLNTGRRVEEDDAVALAQALLAQTRGEPQSLYSILSDDSTWVY